MKKVISLIIAAAMLLALAPTVALAAPAEYSAAALRSAGETVFSAPDPGNTSISDQPVANYWTGWSVDETYGNVNYKYYSIFGDYVVQFYRAEKGTVLTREQSFFENAQDNTGLGRLIAPGGGLGKGSDFLVLDFNLKIGDTGTCYHDYYFKDADGGLILAVRFDINGVYAATDAGDITALGPILERNVSAVQPFSVSAWNKDGKHGVSLEQGGKCVFTKTVEGEINGFGSLDVAMGYYNADYTHTAIGGFKVTAGSYGRVTDEQALAALNIPYNLDGTYSLPTSIFNKSVKWEGYTAPGEKSVYTRLTANINGKTRDFDAMIMGTTDNFVAAYTKTGDMNADASMHLAVKMGGNWQELNFGLGVLFADADLNDGSVAGTTRVMKKPWLYRKDDDSIGVAATTMRLDGSDERLELWETRDLVSFKTVSGKAEGYDNADRLSVGDINGQVTGLLPITEAEADYLVKKLGEVRNTSVEPIKISVRPGRAVTELPGLTANYSDGSSQVIPVDWDMGALGSIDFSKNGAYTVTGKAKIKDYDSPMIFGRADPVVYKYNDKYYFIATDETGNALKLYIRQADTIEGLAQAKDNLIFNNTAVGDMSGCNWAPELHVIGGQLRCLFASGTTGAWNSVQSRVMTCSGDPTNIDSWSTPVRITRADGSPLISEGITLDMTYLEAAGKSYYIWAERPITAAGNGNSQLVIAGVDPLDPTKLTTDPVAIRIPSFGWDRRTATVDEGPNVLKHEGKLFLTFSGSGVDNTYCLGMMSADENADLMNPESWKVTGYPVLASEHVSGELGPGHNSFVKDELGRDTLIVHMKPDGGTRSMTARTIHYGFDGTPILYMTADRTLRPEYRNVEATIIVNDGSVSDEEMELSAILSKIEIPDSDNVRGHITLPAEKDGAVIGWSSSDPAVTPEGIVTRGDKDKKVTLTGTIQKDGVSVSRKFELTVKARPAEKEKVGYIYAYFRGAVNGEAEVQQIHLAISDDGLNWRDLNGNFPVIESSMGTKGLRDPYIIRSYEGDRFYLMATDLDANGGNWGEYGNNGSKYLMFWESDDLVNWSEQRMIKVSDDRMGCTWAPEVIYDEENKEYLIYWASSRADLGQKVIQCARTRDFCTFTEPEIFMGKDYPSVIDTTMVRGDDGRYYRFTKDEEPIKVFMEVADRLDGPYTRIDSNIENITGVEGPGIFQMIDGRYCLMLDGYAGANAGVGFFPLVTDNLASGQFTRLTYGYKMPTGAKHGVMLAITQDEYDAVMDKWGPLPVAGEGTAPAYSYTFENDGSDSEGRLHGSAKVADGVLTLDGSDGGYFSLPDGIFDRRDTFTVSIDVKVDTDKDFFFTFGVGDDNNDYLFLRTKKDGLRAAMTITSNGYEEGLEKAADLSGWHNYTLVGTPDKLVLYLDGKVFEEAAVTKTLYHLGKGLAVSLGKSTWPADSYFAGSYDNVKVYYRALSATEIAEMNGIETVSYSLKVDAAEKKAEISSDMYGIFFEDINFAADGGMYSEAVKNRSFEAAHCNPDRGEAYVKVPGQGWTANNANAQYLSEAPLNKNNTTYLRLDAQAGGGISNDCYGGFAVHKGESFNASLFARGDYDGAVTVSIVNGSSVLGSVTFSNFGKDFEKHSGVIETGATAEAATVKVTFSKAGTLDLDMISVMSRDTYNGRENGLRKDIVQLLADLHPGFMRFPGGCVVEGYYLNNRYSWKDSLGPVESRRENWNRWQTSGNFYDYDYCQTLGLGFYEYFLLCEDIGAKPLPVLGVGIGCQFQSGEVSSWDDLYNIYIQDALDLIEFANGDPETNEWAKIRADMGHPEPFGLEYLGIGNEQWNTAENRFFDRYEAFEEEIHKLYPDIKLISTSGPNSDGIDFDNAWSWLREHKDDKNFTYAVDEHYYRAPEWFLSNVNRYDSYDRDGFSVFAGEYAANGAYGNTLYAALSEAAYMTGLERNADVVKLASYAPLLAKLNNNQWYPDMIWFNNVMAYGSPDYHVQSMFANNNGSAVLAGGIIQSDAPSQTGVGVGTWLTSAQFKNITVTDENGKKTTVDPVGGSLGAWSSSGGVVSQTDAAVEGALATAKISAKNYTLELQAYKTGGGEGFLIPFNYEDENNYIFWNIGGWGNGQHAIQRVSDGAKSTISPMVNGSIESNRWYDIRIEVEDDYARCYLDGQLIHEQYIKLTKGPVYASASEDSNSGDIILKLVNVSRESADVDIDIANVGYVNPTATAYVLAGGSLSDTNSPGAPDNVATVEELFEGASDSFTYQMEPLSFVVLRLHTKKAFALSAEPVEAELDSLPGTVDVSMSDGSVQKLPVEWRVPGGNAFAYAGTYAVEGKINGTNIRASAEITVEGSGCSVEIRDGIAVFEADRSAKAFVAAYDISGRLTGVQTRDFTGRLEIDLPNGAAKVKAFIWDDEMRPLASAVTK